MATFVWTGATDATWSTGSNWDVAGVAQANPPTAADNVAVGTGTGATNNAMTITNGAVCRSLDFTGYTGTVSHAANVTISIGDATAGTSNIALKMSTGMTYSPTSGTTSLISFVSTSTTVQTVTCKTLSNMGALTFNGSGGSWQLAGPMLQSSTGAITLSGGTLDTNNQACSWGLITTSGTRTLTLGSSTITLLGAASSFTSGSAGGLTISANTATFILTGAGAAFNHNASAAINYNGLSLTFSGAGIAQMGSGQVNGTINGLANVTRTGTAIKTDSLTISNPVGTLSGTMTLGGNSTQGVNRLLVQSGTAGTSASITAAAYVINGDVDFMDINLAYSGAASWTNTGSAYIGDCGGNAGAVATNANPSVAQSQSIAAAFTWSTAAWTTRVPLPQDDVTVTGDGSTRTITSDMPRLGRSIDFSAVTNTPSWTHASVFTLFGSFDGTGVTNNSAQNMTFGGRGAYTLKAANALLTSGGFTLTINAPTGTYALTGDLQIANSGVGSTLTVAAGTLDATTFNVSCGVVSSGGLATRGIKIGTGNWALCSTGSINVWAAGTVGNGCTITPGTGTISITATDSGVTKTFAGSNQSYPTLRYTATGSAGLTITGNNTFATLDLECTTARTITLPASGTQTILSNLTLKGAAAQLLSVVSSTPATGTTINCNFGAQDVDSSNTSLSSDITVKITPRHTYKVYQYTSVARAGSF